MMADHEDYVDDQYDQYYGMDEYVLEFNDDDGYRTDDMQYKLSEHMQRNLQYLKEAIHEGKAYEIQNIYENNLAKLMDQSNTSLPHPDSLDLKHILDDSIFNILYRELYYRQLYAKGQPNIHQRLESYSNYVAFFNFILSSTDGPVNLELPNQWLWEIIDEFIYQFQSFSQFRANFAKRTPEELQALAENPKIWNVHSVLNVLHSLVEKSNINQQLEVYTQGGESDSVAGEFGRRPLYKMLGYFSLVGLLRLHSMLGDYYQAVKVLENLQLNKKYLCSRVPACQITTFYYVGFAYLMMRRYADAIRTFTNILVYIQRMKHMFQERTYQVDQMNKQTEQMFSLLAMCLVLHPQRIDESLQQQLEQKLGENMLRMAKGDIEEFEALFKYACPKFLSPIAPTYTGNKDGGSAARGPLQQQLNVFLCEVSNQINIPIIRSYLKLYTTMPVMKLAQFLNPKSPLPFEQVQCELMNFKHKMTNIVWSEGSSLDGEFQTESDVDFYIDDRDMIHVADTKVAQRFGHFFICRYHKFDEMFRAVKSLPM